MITIIREGEKKKLRSLCLGSFDVRTDSTCPPLPSKKKKKKKKKKEEQKKYFHPPLPALLILFFISE